MSGLAPAAQRGGIPLDSNAPQSSEFGTGTEQRDGMQAGKLFKYRAGARRAALSGALVEPALHGGARGLDELLLARARGGQRRVHADA